MRSKLAIGAIGLALGVLLSTAVVVLAGNLNPSGGPLAAGSQMFTLEQIFQRLTTGATGAKMASFTEPAAAPGSTMHTLDDIMAAAPAVDNANGATPADVALGKKYWGLTAGQWGLRTGTATGAAWPAPVPKTGQKTSYAADDDGDLEKGVPWPDPRFTSHPDGTVTDNLTGLIWLKNANCLGPRTWAQAVSGAATLNSGECGLTDGSAEGDWRLPNVRELQSLIHFGYTDPALPNTAGTGQWTEGNPFSGVLSGYYWSSTGDPSAAALAWFVSFFSGDTYPDPTSGENYVWPVRGGQ